MITARFLPSLKTFREYKHYVHEGGIATPLIAHWPKGTDVSRRGALEHQPCHLIDLMATCVDLGAATYPKQVDGHAITPMQGMNLSPAFDGKKLARFHPLFWEHEGNRAMRDGKWKLVTKGARRPWELYAMTSPTDCRSAAMRLAHPSFVDDMLKLLAILTGTHNATGTTYIPSPSR